MGRSWPVIVVDSDDELLHAALLDYAVLAIDEPNPGIQRIFFHDYNERDRALKTLPDGFPHLVFTATEVYDEDWAARSQANLKSVHVGTLTVSPPWDVDPERATTTILIQPSMGFGTGHHATTRLCLAALQQANVPGRSVIDVGTGSGVLAIAASLLGASPVIGIDDDPDAIQNARENLELNPGARVDLRVGDLRSSTLGTADVVLANLTGTLLVQASAQLRTLLTPGGRLILSGLMLQEESAVVSAFAGLHVLDRAQEDEWVCLVLVTETAFR